MTTEMSPRERFVAGEVAQLVFPGWRYWVRRRDADSFDVVMTNKHGAYCDRVDRGRAWVQNRYKEAIRVEWSADVESKSPREYWPTCVEWSPD